MNDNIRRKLEASYAATNDNDSELSGRLLDEAFALCATPAEEREAAQYVRAMLRGRKRTDVCAAKLLGDVRPALSLAWLSKRYFSKGTSWLHQRINENVVNGKPAAFTTEELGVLSAALNDLGQRLLTASADIKAQAEVYKFKS